MPYPVSVPVTRSGYDLGNVARGRFAFEHNLAQYMFVRQGGGNTPTGDFKLHAMKSLDEGLTWTEMDAANAPALTNLAGFNGNYTIALDGTTVIALDVTATAGSPPTLTGIQKWTFDLTTDTWAGPTAFVSIIPDFMGRGTGQVTQVMIQLAVRGPNDYALLYSGPTSGSGGSALGRVYVATFDGTTFGAGTVIPGQSADWFFPQDITYAPVTAKFEISYLKHSNTSLNVIAWDGSTFGSNSVVTTEVNLINQIGSFSELLVYDNSGVETLGIAGFVLSGGTTDAEQFFSAPASTLSWSAPVSISGPSTLPVDQAFYLTGRDISLILANGRLTAFWVFTDFGGVDPVVIFYVTDAPLPGTTWTPVTALFHSSEEVDFFSACQVYAYTRPAGNYGVLGFSAASFSPDTDAEVLDYFTTPIPVTVPSCSLSHLIAGANVTLSWTTTGTPTTASIDHGIGPVNPAGGSVSIPLPDVATTYVLTVSNSAGTSTCQTNVPPATHGDVPPPTCEQNVCDIQPMVISHIEACELLGS